MSPALSLCCHDTLVECHLVSQRQHSLGQQVMHLSLIQIKKQEPSPLIPFGNLTPKRKSWITRVYHPFKDSLEATKVAVEKALVITVIFAYLQRDQYNQTVLIRSRASLCGHSSRLEAPPETSRPSLMLERRCTASRRKSLSPNKLLRLKRPCVFESVRPTPSGQKGQAEASAMS